MYNCPSSNVLRGVDQFLKNRSPEQYRMTPPPTVGGDDDACLPFPELLQQGIEGSDQDVGLVHRPNQHSVNRMVDYSLKS